MKKIVANLIFIATYIVHCNALASTNFSEIEKLTLNSELLGEERELVVYLPANYKEAKHRFPVLYLTDGDVQGTHTKGTLDFLAKFDQAPDMIVVGIVNPRQLRERDLTLETEGKQKQKGFSGADRFLAFIEKEVIPLVKSKYRTLDYQALSGTSHGGQFAINAMVKRPELFDGIIAISPSLYWNKKQLLKLSEVALKNDQLRGRLFISIANEQKVMVDSYKAFIELTQRYPSKKLNVQSKSFNEEDHDSTTLIGQYHGIKHLFSGWSLPKKPLTLADLQEKFSDRSKLLGTDLTIPRDRANGYGQWLQYLNRKDDALTLLKWSRTTYPRSLNSHKSLIKAYLHFNLFDEAKLAVKEASRTINNLEPAQIQALEALLL